VSCDKIRRFRREQLVDVDHAQKGDDFRRSVDDAKAPALFL
jgi:hypothetical protein